MQLNHAGHRTSSLRRSPGPIELMGCLANGSTLGRRALPPWHTGVAAGDRMRGALRRLLGGDTLRRLLGGDTLTQEVSLGPPPCNPFPPLASRGDELATVRLRTERVGRHRCVSTPIPRRRRREESPSRSRTTQIPEMEGREQAGATCCVQKKKKAGNGPRPSPASGPRSETAPRQMPRGHLSPDGDQRDEGAPRMRVRDDVRAASASPSLVPPATDRTECASDERTCRGRRNISGSQRAWYDTSVLLRRRRWERYRHGFLSRWALLNRPAGSGPAHGVHGGDC